MAHTWKVYVLHFDTPYKHAKHYTGIAVNVERRVREHRRGAGAKLTKVLKENNIEFKWKMLKEYETFSEAKNEEKRLKEKVKNAKHYCPYCKAERNKTNGLSRQETEGETQTGSIQQEGRAHVGQLSTNEQT